MPNGATYISDDVKYYQQVFNNLMSEVIKHAIHFVGGRKEVVERGLGGFGWLFEILTQCRTMPLFLID